MTEADLMRLIQIEATILGHRLFRNNVGVARTDNGSVIRFGLCVGSSDLIGWTREGRFLAVEVKTTTGRVRPEQAQFVAAVTEAGGVAGIVRSVKEFRLLVRATLE